MRIVHRTEFLTLPSETVYSRVISGNIYDTLSIKYESKGNDWMYQDVGGFDNWDKSEQLYYRTFEMVDDSSVEYPILCDRGGRDGFFETEEETQFAIYSQDDVKKIIELLQSTIK